MSKVKAISTAVLSVLGMVFAIITLIFSAIPCIGYYALIPAIVALILSVIGIVYLKKEGKSAIVAVLASCIASVAIAISIYQYIQFKSVYDTKDRFENSINHFEEKVQNEAEDAVIDYSKEKVRDYLKTDKKKKKSKKQKTESDKKEK